jgi:enoyl-CoA hydratase
MTITTQKQDAITIITINRPEVKNAVNGTTAQALAEAFREADADTGCNVVILTGSHGTFCAGADLKALALGARGNSLIEDGDGPMGPSRMLLSKPCIAAIEGFAVAGGLELALWCDLRVAAEDAVFGVFCRRFGVPLIDGGTVRLPRLIGLSHALDLILTGRPIHGEEALRMGLANRLTSKGSALSEAVSLAKGLCQFPQLCMRKDRESAYLQDGLSINEALRQEFSGGLAVLQSGETLQGATRFANGEGRHGAFAANATPAGDEYVFEGGCHCGVVRFRMKTKTLEALDCNCSICVKKGFLHLLVPPERFTLLSGQEALTTYTFNTHTAKHTFCQYCGVHPFYTPRSHPNHLDINIKTLDQNAWKRFTIIPFNGERWEESIDTIR